MALEFLSELPEGVLACKVEGRLLALVERGKPPVVNRARVGEGGEVEALGERDRGAVEHSSDPFGELLCLEFEVTL